MFKKLLSTTVSVAGSGNGWGLMMRLDGGGGASLFAAEVLLVGIVVLLVVGSEVFQWGCIVFVTWAEHPWHCACSSSAGGI